MRARTAAGSTKGAIVGMAIPLAVCMATSVSVWDIIIWGIVALIIQILAYRIADALLNDLPTRIENGEIGAAILVLGMKLSIAFINAAAIAG